MSASSPEWEAWVADLDATSKEAGGVWNARVFRPPDRIGLILTAASGDEVAEVALGVIDRVRVRRIQSASSKEPLLCLCCPRRIGPYEWLGAVGVIMPARPDPSRAIGGAICNRCAAADEATLSGKIIAAMRQIVPDAREIPDPAWHKPGHA
jgi:hypothetical protein